MMINEFIETSYTPPYQNITQLWLPYCHCADFNSNYIVISSPVGMRQVQ